MRPIYKVSKSISGFSTCFRQWRSTSHCQFLHGYALSFTLHFETCQLDGNDWVIDFAFMKDSSLQIDNMTISNWFSHQFDHTTLIAKDDPHLEHFKTLEAQKLIQLRIMENISTEKFSEYIYHKLAPFISNKTKQMTQLVQVDTHEHERNTASYIMPAKMEKNT